MSGLDLRGRASEILPRFSAKYRSDASGCWVWTAAVDPAGYGRFGIARRTFLAHRVSYAVHIGAVPDALFVCHRCDRPACVNPSHLFLGTNAQNVADMDAKGRRRTVARTGDAAGSTKIPDADLVRVLALHRRGMTQVALGRLFGVSHTAIQFILSGRRFAQRAP